MRFQVGRGVLVSCVAASLAALFFFFASLPAASQSGTREKCLGCSVDGKTTPVTDGHPDLNGYWGGAFGGGNEQFQRTADGSILYDFSLHQGEQALCASDACQAPNQPSYTPAYMARVKAIAKTEFAGTTPEDPMLACKPGGVPRSTFQDNSGSNGIQIIETPQALAIIHGDYTDRVIYTDGRQHPKDMEPSYMGNSVGHWEENTLVVDVAGLNDDTWLGGGGFTGDVMYTSIHSDKEHVVERWTREGDVLTYEATVDDPVALTKPWVIAPRKLHINPDPEAYVISYYCDASGLTGALKDHYVKPNPEDRDIKNNCNGHHCEAAKPTPPPAAVPNRQ